MQIFNEQFLPAQEKIKFIQKNIGYIYIQFRKNNCTFFFCKTEYILSLCSAFKLE